MQYLAHRGLEPGKSTVRCFFHEETRECSKPNIYRCRRAALQTYQGRLKHIFEEVKNRLPDEIQNSKDKTGQRADLEKLSEYFNAAIVGTPITKSDYASKKRERGPCDFVFCSQEEAEIILEQGPPTMPIVVPPPPMTPGERDEHIKDQKKLIRQVETNGWVDVYDSGATIHNDRKTVKMSVQEAMRRVNSDEKPPINMLNNPIPPENARNDWMASISGYGMADKVVNLAKRAGLDLTDFRESMLLRLDGSTGAVTLLHVEKDGETTRILCAVGIKIWLISKVLAGEEELREFANTRTCSDNTFVLLIDEGYQLIQPPSTIHAVYTYARSVQFCFEYYDARTLARSLSQSQVDLELGDNSVANEDSYKSLPEFYRICMECCEKEMRMGWRKRWPDMKDGEKHKQAKNDLLSIKYHMEKAILRPKTDSRQKNPSNTKKRAATRSGLNKMEDGRVSKKRQTGRPD
ncbi:hypothetical protein IWW34DRAFT_708987 [Fusarium oxysporum f. sp. albedinis]|nr:hypothetical protein IWW34DRAFT_708987 [Fusarium oxysporum f. sp. albedinis]